MKPKTPPNQHPDQHHKYLIAALRRVGLAVSMEVIAGRPAAPERRASW